MSRGPELFKKKKDCCGCNACQQICPKSAISMTEDNEGFLYPVIDYKKCVSCGLCEKVCPIKETNSKTDEIIKCYVAYAKDEEVRVNSSSGGMFTLLAEEILKRGGIVVGATFDEKWRVHHICIDSVIDLQKLRGSKYTQSRLNNTYKEVKEFLEKGKEVLFTGTECQISGLKKYLSKEYENLFTVDVLCHGVPSPKVWDKYIKSNISENHSDIKHISFRNKETGWKNYSVKMEFENSKEYRENFSKDLFMRMFLSEICLRPSCHDCRFKKLERNADVTIGDCWGIGNYMPEMDDDKGTSVILIHSDKGRKIWESILDKIIYKEAERDKALSPNADSRKSVVPHINRKKFFRKLSNGESIESLEKLLELSLWRRIRRKIVRYIMKI